MRKVTVIPIVVGALGAISNRFEKFVKEVGIHIRVEHVQKTALLGSARILSLVLGSKLPGSRECEFLGIWLMPAFTGGHGPKFFSKSSDLWKTLCLVRNSSELCCWNR